MSVQAARAGSDSSAFSIQPTIFSRSAGAVAQNALALAGRGQLEDRRHQRCLISQRDSLVRAEPGPDEKLRMRTAKEWHRNHQPRLILPVAHRLCSDVARCHDCCDLFRIGIEQLAHREYTRRPQPRRRLRPD